MNLKEIKFFQALLIIRFRLIQIFISINITLRALFLFYNKIRSPNTYNNKKYYLIYRKIGLIRLKKICKLL